MKIEKKGRILILSVLLALAVFAVSLGTSAVPNHKSAGEKNTIASGTLYIGGTTGSRGILDKIIALSNWMVGAAPRKVYITLKNRGSREVRVSAMAVYIAETDRNLPADALKMEVKDQTGQLFYKGSLLAADKKQVPLEPAVLLKPHKEVRLCMLITLDKKLGDSLKDKPLYFSLAMFASP